MTKILNKFGDDRRRDVDASIASSNFFSGVNSLHLRNGFAYNTISYCSIELFMISGRF